jgi:hypothetical protein
MSSIDIPITPLTTSVQWGAQSGYVGIIFWNNHYVTEYSLDSESSYMAKDELDQLIVEKLRKVFD